MMGGNPILGAMGGGMPPDDGSTMVEGQTMGMSPPGPMCPCCGQPMPLPDQMGTQQPMIPPQQMGQNPMGGGAPIPPELIAALMGGSGGAPPAFGPGAGGMR